jgi:predicted dehydrogenase
VKLVAMADAFPEPLDNSLRAISSQCPDQVDVPPERRFVGLDSFQKAIECDVDMVLLCSPPGFRPAHFEAAVRAGRHVFMEKPVAVDAPGVRRVLAANQLAKEKKLAVAVGHHLRHEVKHREVISRIHDGMLGDIRFVRIYFNSGGVWFRPRRPGQTEMQFQVANWYYFTWLSGDHIVEQHVHDIDVANWILRAHPLHAWGMGGRQVRTPQWAVAQGMPPDTVGEIFDHHSVEFEYPDGVRVFSVCRHMPGCWNAFAQAAHGTKGIAEIQGHGPAQIVLLGQDPLRFERGPDGHQLEMDHLFAALLAGEPYNEGDWAAESTMTAILGRMATYSGKEIDWETAMNSDLELGPRELSWDSPPPVRPNEQGFYPCAIPGQTRAW